MEKIEILFSLFFKCTISQINNFKMSFTNQEPVECPICFDAIGEKNNITTECGHKFHASCLMTNISRNGFDCPCCRAVMAEVESEAESDDEGTEYDEDDDDEDTLIDDTLEPFSDDSLRGLRLLTNLLEGEQHDQADVVAEYQYNEEESNVIPDAATPPPSLVEVIHFFRDQDVSYEQLVAFILLDHEEYDSQVHDLERFSGDLWGRLRILISNYTPPAALQDADQDPIQDADQEPVQDAEQIFNDEDLDIDALLSEWDSTIYSSSESEIDLLDLEIEEDGSFFIQDRHLTIADLDELRVDLDMFMVDFSAQPKIPICV
jgi:hypothetical protein